MHSMGCAVKKQYIIQGPINYHKSIVTSNWKKKHIYIYILGTYLSSIFLLQPSKTRPFQIKTRVTWAPGIYIYM